MTTQTVLLIILAVIVALVLVLFQYHYQAKKNGKLRWVLSFLRFIAWFGAFLLLINPKFSKNTYTLEKSNLIVLADNSTSVKETDIPALVQKMKETDELSDKFKTSFHSFGSTLNTSDSLTFQERNTNITEALKTAQTIYGGTNNAVVLLSDGNQTLGANYEFSIDGDELSVHPLVVGDTTRYEDLRIGQLNSNKYAFLKNKYPLEVYVNYEGQNRISSTLSVMVNGKRAYRENIVLSNDESTKIINVLLDANAVGIQNIEVSVAQLGNERNTANNKRKVAVEVIDEKTNVFIISNIVHPDIGALKKSIESNEQRVVTIKKSDTDLADLAYADVLILYQPTPAFRGVYQFVQERKMNTFTITGPKTDWDFLNRVQSAVTKNSYEQSEETVPILNAGFSLFDVTDFSVVDFPPLESNLGDVMINKSHEVLMGQQVKGVELNEPLWAVLGSDNEREALLFGENLWKWRMQSYRNEQDFNSFDNLIGKLMLYLSTTKPKARFTIDYESVYEGSTGAKIIATYFDKAFSFDPNATIEVQLKNKENAETRSFPMLLKGGYYEADLTTIPAGKYDFTATVAGEKLSQSGAFTILDFDVEQQLQSSDYQKLGRLASNTSGTLYFSTQIDTLIKDLLASERFVPTQKSAENIVSLIDFRFLLGIIVVALGLEWFIRKYNGLI